MGLNIVLTMVTFPPDFERTKQPGPNRVNNINDNLQWHVLGDISTPYGRSY